MRLINAELLTTNIALTAKNCARSNAQKALVGRILFMIDNMPTIEAEPNPNKDWISVEDRLPEPFTTVLAYYINGRIHTVGYIDKFMTSDTVTHWIPLPEPPKGE